MSDSLPFQGYNWGQLIQPGDVQVRLVPDDLFKSEDGGEVSNEQKEIRLKQFILTLQNVRGQIMQLDVQLQNMSKEALKKAGVSTLADDLTMLHRIVALLGPQIEWTLIPMTQMEQRLRIEELSRVQRKVFESNPPLTNTHWDTWKIARNSPAWLNGFHGPKKGDFKGVGLEAATSGKNQMTFQKGKGKKAPLLPPPGQTTWGIQRPVHHGVTQATDATKGGKESFATTVATREGTRVAVTDLSVQQLLQLYNADKAGIKKKLTLEKDRLIASPPEEGENTLLKVVRFQQKVLSDFEKHEKASDSEDWTPEKDETFSWADDSEQPENLLSSADDNEKNVKKKEKDQSESEHEDSQRIPQAYKEKLLGKKTTRKGPLIIEE